MRLPQGPEASQRQHPICRPGGHATFARDHEYKRHGTVSLLAGIDLLTEKVHPLVRDRHRSREFVEFLKLLDAAYPASTAIKVILDNHSAHISKETKTWLATRPTGRFEFTSTPKHGSWLNLIEGFLRLNGIGTGINGIRLLSGAALIIENCDIFGLIMPSGAAIGGIEVAPNAGARVLLTAGV